MDKRGRTPASFRDTFRHPWRSMASVFRLIVNLPWKFLRRWVTSRPLASLAWGVPAVVVAAVVGLLAVSGQRFSASHYTQQYRDAAIKADRRGDTKAAALWLVAYPNVEILQLDQAWRLANELAGQHDRPDQVETSPSIERGVRR